MDISRLTRGEFLALRSSEFVAAANVVGMNPWRIAWRHILPNASGPIIVAATLRIAEAIILEYTLSFIGRMDYYPNQECMQRFCKDVWPRLRARRPGMKLLIVGALLKRGGIIYDLKNILKRGEGVVGI